MSSDLFVSYLHAGPREAAQRAAVEHHLRARGALAAEIVEAGADRPRLHEALALCRRRGATLLMAELGAFRTDPPLLRALGSALRRLELRFAALDCPEASEATLGIMAALAETEGRWAVSRSPETVARRHEFYARVTADGRARPRAGRAGAPASGRLPLDLPPPPAEGGASARRSRERAEEVAPLLNEIRAAGALTLEQVANALNALGVPSARGPRWYPMQVTRIERRLAAGHAALRSRDTPFDHPLHA